MIATNEIWQPILDLRDMTSLPEPGWGWREPEAAWWRLLGQICAVGSSRSWAALEGRSVRDVLRVTRIREEGDHAAQHVHRVLAAAGVRYCSEHRSNSVKAMAIAQNAMSLWVADEHGHVQLLKSLREVAGPPQPNGYFCRRQARTVRKALIEELRFFGPKSASDFLLGLGLTDCLIALDVRILNLLVDNLGWSPACRRQVASLQGYTELEEEVARKIAEPIGINLLTLDRVLFCHYKELKCRWRTIRPQDGQTP